MTAGPEANAAERRRWNDPDWTSVWLQREQLTDTVTGFVLEHLAAEAGQRVLDAMRSDSRPKLFLWADSDPVLPLSVGERFASALGGQLEVVEQAGHFLQEDAGERIGRRIAEWLSSS